MSRRRPKAQPQALRQQHSSLFTINYSLYYTTTMNKTTKPGFLPAFFLATAFLAASCASSASYESAPAAFSEYGGSRSASAMSSEYSVSRSRSAENESEERMVTYTASIRLSVKDVDGTRNGLAEHIEQYNGYITREAVNSITARIPAEYMDAYITYAKTLGNVESESKTGQDITDQYRDNVIRLESLQAVRDRYLVLLDRANAVNEILSIERELERVNLEIDLIEGRIRHAEASVAYSSITVRFDERAKPGPLGWVFYGLYRGIVWLFVW